MRAVGGWGLMFGTESQIKLFFFLGPSLRNMVESAKLGQQGRRLAMYVRPIQRQWTFNLPAKISLTTGNLIIICEDGLICFNSNLVQRTFWNI